MNAGGGYGDPLDRDPELVLGDFVDGYVSLSGAREDYGVVINPETHTIDTNATTSLRNQMRKK
jgi:N-methylhydantoinase B